MRWETVSTTDALYLLSSLILRCILTPRIELVQLRLAPLFGSGAAGGQI
jgi:hypothetical protein